MTDIDMRIKDIDVLISSLEDQICAMGVKKTDIEHYITGSVFIGFEVTSDVHLFLPEGYISRKAFLFQLKQLQEHIKYFDISIEAQQKEIDEYTIRIESAKEKGSVFTEDSVAVNMRRSRQSALVTSLQGLGNSQRQLYVLNQKTPIDAEAFYALLTPKLNELTELLNKRSALRLERLGPAPSAPQTP